MGLTMTAITFAATIDRVLNGLTRPFFGWVSDKIGRENTMFIAFAMEGVGIYLLYLWGHDPIWFVLLSGFVFFAWGEIYSLFPSTCTDTFGAKFAATNAGLLYTAKGTAALLVPVAQLPAAVEQQLGRRLPDRGGREHPRLDPRHRRAQALAPQRRRQGPGGDAGGAWRPRCTGRVTEPRDDIRTAPSRRPLAALPPALTRRGFCLPSINSELSPTASSLV